MTKKNEVVIFRKPSMNKELSQVVKDETKFLKIFQIHFSKLPKHYQNESSSVLNNKITRSIFYSRSIDISIISKVVNKFYYKKVQSS